MEHDPTSGAGPSTTGNERHEALDQAPPRIYVASLADYVAGELHGEWIDATQDIEDIRCAIDGMLARPRTNSRAEEYAIHDTDGFGAYRVGEYEPIERVAAVARGIVEHGPAFAAWAAECDGDLARLADFDDAYLGNYDSTTDYAEQLADDIGLQHLIDEHIPDSLQAYVTVDTAALARDLELGGDITTVEHPHGVWIFDPRM